MARARYNLDLGDELYSELKTIAEKRHTTVSTLIRRFIKLGMLALSVEEKPSAAVIFREGKREERILLL